MSAIAIVAGAILCGCAWRWRGTGHLALGRILCALLVALPGAFADWPWGAAAFGPVAGLAWAAACLDHNPNPESLPDTLLSSLTGLAFTLAPSVALAVLGHWTGAVALAIAGLLKGPCYRLPRGPAADLKFLWRELAFGAAWGAAAGLALWLEVTS